MIEHAAGADEYEVRLEVDAQVVFLDDLHWADAGSIDVLCAVAAQVSTTRVAVVGTYRDDEVAAGSALRSVSGAVDRLHLGALGSDDIAAVLAETLERAPTPFGSSSNRARPSAKAGTCGRTPARSRISLH